MPNKYRLKVNRKDRKQAANLGSGKPHDVLNMLENWINVQRKKDAFEHPIAGSVTSIEFEDLGPARCETCHQKLP